MIFPSLKQIEKFAVDNSPTILTVIGVVGTIGTAVLTHKAATKAERLVADHGTPIKYTKPGANNTDPRDVVRQVWKIYIPPVVSGTVTMGCVVMANRIGSKRAAAIAAAYTIAERAHTEYREKVIEKMGDIKERAVRDEIAEDRVRKNPPGEDNIILIGTGETLCCELYTGRYFRSSAEAIRKAVNETNYQINSHGYASLSDFYSHVGLPNTAVSDQVGWTSDKMMDVDITAILMEDDRPCLAFNFQTGPVRNHDRFH